MGHGGADLLGVDAQVVLLHQVEADGVGDAPEAQLDAVSVPHHLGDVAGDGLLLLPDGGILELVDGLVHLVEHVGHGHGQGVLPHTMGVRALTSKMILSAR